MRELVTAQQEADRDKRAARDSLTTRSPRHGPRLTTPAGMTWMQPSSCESEAFKRFN